ncbi:DUF1127 domain-containing protein (plasmid) [Aminobacter sp. SR38]|jgi:uncharacterized protein YjiS (DUF1127 family)|nr:DUF1127 domain-containing protein [Aminobacter sp. SR38]QOF74630.1 DUF1127 domain-containing protein [Aminobacter sp. SR38]
MTTLTIRSPAAGLVSSLVSRIAAAHRAFWLHRAHRRAVWNLGELDDYLLKDIGVARSEIQSLVSDPSGDRKRGHEHDVE